MHKNLFYVIFYFIILYAILIQLTINITTQFLWDYSCIVVFVPQPLVQEEGCVSGAGVKHNPILRKSDKEFLKVWKNLDLFGVSTFLELNTPNTHPERKEFT